jgi:hypothetical protein
MKKYLKSDKLFSFIRESSHSAPKEKRGRIEVSTCDHLSPQGVGAPFNLPGGLMA